MPISKSAKKSLRQSFRKKEGNLEKKNVVKKTFKEIKKLVEKKDKDSASKLLPQLYKSLDKAAKIGVIKKGNASRRKSRITKAVNKTA